MTDLYCKEIILTYVGPEARQFQDTERISVKRAMPYKAANGTLSVKEMLLLMVPVRTRFRRETHGFQFINNFKNLFLPEDIAHYTGMSLPLEIGTGGRCGGMCYTAMDYYSRGRSLPAGDKMPRTGSVLDTYLFQRQLQSLQSTVDRFVGFLADPNHGGRFTACFDPNGNDFRLLKQMLDRGEPAQLGLPHSFDPQSNHQVLAIGYSTGRRDAETGLFKDLRVYIYEPNSKREGVLIPDYALGRFREYLFSEAGISEGNKYWLAYFVDDGYVRRVPPRDNPVVLDWSGADHSGKVFYGRDFRKANFVNTRFVNSQLVRVDLEGADARGAVFSGARVLKSNLYDVDLTGAHLRSASLEYSCLKTANFARATMEGANLRHCQLRETTFDEAVLTRADLSSVDAEKARFVRCAVTGADMRGGDFSGAVFEDADLTGVDLRHDGSKKANLEGADLTRATLAGANLVGARCAKANFSNANLSPQAASPTNLRSGNFPEAVFTNAVFRASSAIIDCRYATFGSAYMSGVDFRSTGSKIDFRHANLYGADLSNADFSARQSSIVDFRYAILTRAVLTGADFRPDASSIVDFTGASLANAECAGARFEGAVLPDGSIYTTGDDLVERFGARSNPS